MNAFGYSEAVWELFTRAPRAGTLAGSPGILTARAHTPASRSVLQLQVRAGGGRVEDARFQAYGCPTTIAVGAWLAEWAVGKDLGDLGSVSAKTLREALEIPEERAHCAFLGEDAVKALTATAKTDGNAGSTD